MRTSYSSAGEVRPRSRSDIFSVGPFVRNGPEIAFLRKTVRLHCHAVTVRGMRVHELAWELDLTSRDLIDQLRADGEWIASHLSVVPQPVVARLLGDRPARPRPRRVSAANTLIDRPWNPLPPRPRARPPRRPGYGRLTLLTWEDDDWHGSRRRPGSEVTTSDVAELLGVRPATVRRWVSRGYLPPIGMLGPTHVFRTTEVYAARDAIWKRRKATGDGRRGRDDDWYLPGRHQPMERIAYKHWDKPITIDNAARIVEVSPSTIRSWIHRGYLTPLPSSTRRSTQLRTGDVLNAARARRLPRHLPPTWRAPAP